MTDLSGTFSPNINHWNDILPVLPYLQADDIKVVAPTNVWFIVVTDHNTVKMAHVIGMAQYKKGIRS